MVVHIEGAPNTYLGILLNRLFRELSCSLNKSWLVLEAGVAKGTSLNIFKEVSGKQHSVP